MSSAVKGHPAEAAVSDAGESIQPGNTLFGIVWMNPKRVSGAPCFYKTRVPIRNLFDSLEAGESLDEFLDGFEGVTREQAQAVLRLAADHFIRDIGSLWKSFLITTSTAGFDRICQVTTSAPPVNSAGSFCQTAFSSKPLPTRFDVFLTIDKNIEFEQNLQTLPLPVVVIDTRSSALESLLPFAGPLLNLFATKLDRALYIQPEAGPVIRLTAPRLAPPAQFA